MYSGLAKTAADLKPVVEAVRSGQAVMLFDDAGPQHCAYLLFAAHRITPADICFMVNHGRGVIMAALSEMRIKELGLPMMVARSADGSPDLSVSVEARHGVSTGISAGDRAHTLQTLAKTKHPNLDLVTPGHIFPVRAKNGGVLVRSAVAEAAVDLLMMAGVIPVAALCHCLNEHGAFASEEELRNLIAQFSPPLVSVADIIRERLSREPIIERVATAVLPVRDIGEFAVHCFRSHIDGSEHVALVKGPLGEPNAKSCSSPVLARVQAESRMEDLFGLNESSSRRRMKKALQRIAESECGVLVYVRQPSRSTLAEMTPSVTGANNTAVQLREYGIGAQILNYLGAKKIRLLTGSSREVTGIEAFQIEIVERIPL